MQAIIDGDLVPLLVDAVSDGETEVIVKEAAAHAIGNIAGGSQQQVRTAADGSRHKTIPHTYHTHTRILRLSMWLSVAASSPSATCSMATMTIERSRSPRWTRYWGNRRHTIHYNKKASSGASVRVSTSRPTRASPTTPTPRYSSR